MSRWSSIPFHPSPASRSTWTRSASTSCSPARKKRSPFRPAFPSSLLPRKAFARAEKIPNRGYYFDFIEFKNQQAEWMTQSTPSIGHIHALQSKLDEIFEEGLDARFARHARTNALVHDWVRRTGFDFFAEEGFRTKTLTCVKNNRGIDVAKLVRDLRAKHHLVIDGGYGPIKGKTFRLSNMGDETGGNRFTFARLSRRLFVTVGTEGIQPRITRITRMKDVNFSLLPASSFQSVLSAPSAVKNSFSRATGFTALHRWARD